MVPSSTTGSTDPWLAVQYSAVAIEELTEEDQDTDESAKGINEALAVLGTGSNAIDGAAHVYYRNDIGIWHEETVLTAPKETECRSFAYSIALDKNTLLVAADTESRTGVVFSYARFVHSRTSKIVWKLIDTLYPHGTFPVTFFGKSN